jgi:sugar lactone lactonase YvrE
MSDIENNGIQKKVFLSMNNIDGNPDGMAVDKNGNLWVAMWGSGKVCCFNALRVTLN